MNIIGPSGLLLLLTVHPAGAGCLSVAEACRQAIEQGQHVRFKWVAGTQCWKVSPYKSRAAARFANCPFFMKAPEKALPEKPEQIPVPPQPDVTVAKPAEPLKEGHGWDIYRIGDPEQPAPKPLPVATPRQPVVKGVPIPETWAFVGITMVFSVGMLAYGLWGYFRLPPYRGF